jgi:hypothetical protein
MECQRAREQASSNSTGSCGSLVDVELERYIGDIKNKIIDNGLTFWLDMKNQMSYSLIAPLAMDLLALPASQAYVERVFSVCGDLCARKRNRMCRNLEQRAFLKMNRHYFDKL